MFNRKILTALVTSALVGLGGYASVVLSASTTGSAAAVIVAPIAIAADGTNNLSFGDISPNTGSGGTVTVTTAGVRSGAGVGLAGGTVGFGGFDVTGCNNCAFNVTPPSPPTTLTSGPDTMQITAYTSANSSPLDGTGAGTVSIGGTLTVGAGQNAGTYNGTYTVTVDYP